MDSRSRRIATFVGGVESLEKFNIKKYQIVYDSEVREWRAYRSRTGLCSGSWGEGGGLRGKSEGERGKPLCRLQSWTKG